MIRAAMTGLPILRIAAFAIAISLLAATPAVAGDVAGTVYDAYGAPAADMAVAIPELGIETMTGADGTYRLEGVDAGEHELAVSLGAAAKQRVGIDVPATGTLQRNVILFSARVVEQAIGGATPADASEAFAEALDLADQMTQDEAPQAEIAWRWNDLEG